MNITSFSWILYFFGYILFKTSFIRILYQGQIIYSHFYNSIKVKPNLQSDPLCKIARAHSRYCKMELNYFLEIKLISKVKLPNPLLRPGSRNFYRGKILYSNFTGR